MPKTARDRIAQAVRVVEQAQQNKSTKNVALRVQYAASTPWRHCKTCLLKESFKSKALTTPSNTEYTFRVVVGPDSLRACGSQHRYSTVFTRMRTKIRKTRRRMLECMMSGGPKPEIHTTRLNCKDV